MAVKAREWQMTALFKYLIYANLGMCYFVVYPIRSIWWMIVIPSIKINCESMLSILVYMPFVVILFDCLWNLGLWCDSSFDG